MKNLLDRFKGMAGHRGAESPRDHAPVAPDDEGFFSTQFMERPESIRGASAWTARALGVGAHKLPADEGLQALEAVWGRHHLFVLLSPNDRISLSRSLEFVAVPAGRELILQGEKGDYALIVLEGAVAVERTQPTGQRVRLSEACAGEVLGEMSLLELGARFASCTTLTATRLAVLTADVMDNLAVDSPTVGMAVMACVAQRVSVRTRQISAKLAALLAAAQSLPLTGQAAA